MLHDKAGHAWVTFASPIATNGSDTAYGVTRGEYWLLHAVKEGVAGSPGDRPKVVCTSAGRTTRLVLDLVESRQGIDSREAIDSTRAKYDSSDTQPFVPSSDNVRLVSTQDDSIISAICSNIHLQVSRGEQLGQTIRHESDVSGAHVTDENACCLLYTSDAADE